MSDWSENLAGPAPPHWSEPLAGRPKPQESTAPGGWERRIAGTPKPTQPSWNKRLTRNLNPGQFGSSRVGHAIETGLNVADVSKAMRHAGFGPAIRYSLGLEQTPRHVGDVLRGRLLRSGSSTHGMAGSSANPSNIEASYEPPAGEED